jgi:hypothetical protein
MAMSVVALADFGVGQKFRAREKIKCDFIFSRAHNPRNISQIHAVIIFARLELDETISFLDGHKFS